MMSAADNYEGFITDLGREVLNRNEIREQQKREVARLENTLKNLRLHQTFLQDQTKVFFFFFLFFLSFFSFLSFFPLPFLFLPPSHSPSPLRNTTLIWKMCCSPCTSNLALREEDLANKPKRLVLSSLLTNNFKRRECWLTLRCLLLLVDR